jgi:hypothetical protein
MESAGSNSKVQTSTVSWTTSDDFQLVPECEKSARGVVQDATGTLIVTGMARDTAGVEHWITRKLGM